MNLWQRERRHNRSIIYFQYLILRRIYVRKRGLDPNYVGFLHLQARPLQRYADLGCLFQINSCTDTQEKNLLDVLFRDFPTHHCLLQLLMYPQSRFLSIYHLDCVALLPHIALANRIFQCYDRTDTLLYLPWRSKASHSNTHCLFFLVYKQRVSILSEFAIIPEVVEKEISAYLINL